MTGNTEKPDGSLARGHHRTDVPDNPRVERVQEFTLRLNVEHLYGPKTLDLEIDELAVLVLLRNGRPYIESFVEHYFALGVKHIVFLDNGSTDGTVEALQRYQHVTVLQTQLPYKTYNLIMKRYLIERFGRGRWTLTVDIDELFEYPYSNIVSLKALLSYLTKNSYTAVVAFMLDMFAEEPLSESASFSENASLKETQRYYDISYVRSRSYHDVGEIGNVLANEDIKILRGGVTRRLFGVSQFLIKHPLVFLDDKLKPMDLSDHWAGNARIADFTGILLHYKLANSLYKLVQREIKERKYTNQQGKYDRFSEVLEGNTSLTIKNDVSRELKSPNDLIGTQLVSVSRQFMKFVDEQERRRDHYSEGDFSERLLDAFLNAKAEVATLADQLETMRQENQLLRRENRNIKAEARRVHNQIRTIQGSRNWRISMILDRVDARVRGTLGRLKERTRKRDNRAADG